MNELFFKEPIFICAGEPSGDLYASLLVKKLKGKNPHSKIYAAGGHRLREIGAEIVEDYNNLMTFGFFSGFFSVLRHYRVHRKIARAMHRVQPKTFIAVAYPGINLLLCRYAKKLRCRVCYFLPPQIWAWGEFRKYFIKKWVDSVISIFPFEHKFYNRRNIKTDCLENPLFNELIGYKRNDFKKRIGFMPGSRRGEIKRNLPVAIELMRKIARGKPDIEFNLILHSNNSEIKHVCPANVVTEDHYQTMRNCDLLIISSGTASLEAAIMGIPQIFFNRPSFFDYYIFKKFLRIKEYNLANLYFNKKMVPSFVSRNAKYIFKNVDRAIAKFFD